MVKGRALPEWFLGMPPEIYGLKDYLDAFRSLSTCRSSGMSLGGIPWTAMDQYASRFEMTDTVAELFYIAMECLDGAYRDWIEEIKPSG